MSPRAVPRAPLHPKFFLLGCPRCPGRGEDEEGDGVCGEGAEGGGKPQRPERRRPLLLQIPSSIKLYLVSAVDSASILLVVQGTAVGTSTAAASEMALRRGSVLFVSANESISLRLSSPDGMLLFRACCLL